MTMVRWLSGPLRATYDPFRARVPTPDPCNRYCHPGKENCVTWAANQGSGVLISLLSMVTCHYLHFLNQLVLLNLIFGSTFTQPFVINFYCCFLIQQLLKNMGATKFFP